MRTNIAIVVDIRIVITHVSSLKLSVKKLNYAFYDFNIDLPLTNLSYNLIKIVMLTKTKSK